MAGALFPDHKCYIHRLERRLTGTDENININKIYMYIRDVCVRVCVYI